MEDSHQNPRETEAKNIETILSSQDDLENKNIMFIDFPSINSLSVLNEKDMKNSYTMNKRNKRPTSFFISTYIYISQITMTNFMFNMIMISNLIIHRCHKSLD